jgi:hypothetical protein
MRLSGPVALLTVGAALLGAGVALSFWAGCTGDLKGGSLGDPAEALRLQSYSAGATVAAVAMLVSAASAVQSAGSGTKFKLVVAAVLAPMAVWLGVGWSAELYGVTRCLSAA